MSSAVYTARDRKRTRDSAGIRGTVMKAIMTEAMDEARAATDALAAAEGRKRKKKTKTGLLPSSSDTKETHSSSASSSAVATTTTIPIAVTPIIAVNTDTSAANTKEEEEEEEEDGDGDADAAVEFAESACAQHPLMQLAMQSLDDPNIGRFGGMTEAQQKSHARQTHKSNRLILDARKQLLALLPNSD
jgi:hypothetical protein